MSITLLFRGKIITVTEATTQSDLIAEIVKADSQLADSDIELKLCEVKLYYIDLLLYIVFLSLRYNNNNIINYLFICLLIN